MSVASLEVSSQRGMRSQEQTGGMNSFSLLTDDQMFHEKSERFRELQQRLNSKFEKDKLDAMKRLVSWMTLGRDVSSFFPAVVKNVIVENIEVKKLVYMYLIHYAETNADLALLSINSFQKDLSSSNPRVRTNAMRAMSSIRIPVVIPLVIIGLWQAVKDSSPLVRKCAACAIPKVFAVDPTQREELVDMIKQLLKNDDTEVLGCAMFAFMEVCPDDFELLHPHFRKICHLVADFDEWGQVVCLAVLLRYGRTQFASPFLHEAEEKSNGNSIGMDEPFYPESDDEESKNKTDEDQEMDHYEMAEDHRLLLKAGAQLVHSRNAGVICGVAALYHHLAPPSENRVVAKALVRMSRHHSGVQFSVLSVIATLARKRPQDFRPYVKDFFVYSVDPLPVRELKIDIMANLATETSIGPILKEFQHYVTDPDKRFVTATIQAIGRCAVSLPEIAERCMKGLMNLVSSPTEVVVAEAIVVMRQLLQKNPVQHKGIVRHVVALVDTVKNAKARTAIVWMLGEYRDSIPKLAPDALRKLAKTFRTEDLAVKRQILNFAVKMYLSNPKQCAKLFKYVMDLAKFDLSYDLRDRARMLRAIFFKKKKKPDDESKVPIGAIADANPLGIEDSEMKDALKLGLLSAKPEPQIEFPFQGRERFVLNSLSHVLNQPVQGYTDLPEFPEKNVDPEVRAPLEEQQVDDYSDKKHKKKKKKKKGGDTSKAANGKNPMDIDDFYADSGPDEEEDDGSSSDSDSDSDDSSSSSDDDDDTSSSSSDSDSSSSSGSDSDGSDKEVEEQASDDDEDVGPAVVEDSDEELEVDETPFAPVNTALAVDNTAGKPGTATPNTDGSKSDASDELDVAASDDDDEDVGSSSKKKSKKKKKKKKKKEKEKEETEPNAQDDILGGLDQQLQQLDVSAAFGGGDSKDDDKQNEQNAGGVRMPSSGAKGKLVSQAKGNGLEISYVFSRKPSVYDADAVAVSLKIWNRHNDTISDITVDKDDLESAGIVRAFDPILELGAGETREAKLHIKFTSDQCSFKISTSRGGFRAKLTAPPGELLKPLDLSDDDFTAKLGKLTGMQETSFKSELTSAQLKRLPQCIANQLNVSVYAPGDSGLRRFAGTMRKDGGACLLHYNEPADLSDDDAKHSITVSVNCEDFMFINHVMAETKKALAEATK